MIPSNSRGAQRASCARTELAIAAMLAIALGVSPVAAQENAPPPSPAPTPPAPADGAAPAPAPDGTKPAETKPAETKPTETKPTEKPDEVQLSFQGAKIDVVLKWLNQVTGKTIIKHPKVNVQLSVMSTRKLTKAQAMRMVYQALSLQGITAVESKEAIYVLPEGEASKIPPSWLGGSDGEVLEGKHIVAVPFRLSHAKPSALQEKVKSVLSPQAKIQIDDGARSLIITDSADNVRLAREFIRELDVPTTSDAVTKIITIEHAKPDDISSLIKKMYASGKPIPKEDGEGDGKPTVTVAADSIRLFTLPPNRLHITAPRSIIDRIEKMIETLDVPIEQDVAVRVIQLGHVDAEELAEELSDMYRSLRRESGEMREVSANQRSNSIIVLSSKRDFEDIKKLVDTLDTPEAEKAVWKTVLLENHDAEDLAEQLTELYQGMSGSSSRYGYYDYWGYSYRRRRGNNNTETRFVADRRRNAIMILAAPGQLKSIEDMVKEMDAPVDGSDLAPRIIPLKYVRAYDVEDVLNTLFLKKDTRSYWDWDSYDEEDNDIGRLYGKVRITSESYSNSIIVASNSEENLAAIEEVVRKLDVASPTGETTLRVPLNHARAVTVANNLNILFAQAGAGAVRQNRQQEQNRNQPQQQNNETLSRGYELEEDILEEAYFPWLTSGEREGRQTLSGRPVRTGGDLVGKVRVVPDHRTNSLLITTNSHLFSPVISLVDELDIPTAQVLIEAEIIEISQDDRERLGLRFSPDGARVFDDEDFDNSLIGRGMGEYTEVFSGSRLPDAMRTGILSSAIDLDVLVQFLRKNTSARIRAEPRINVSNNGLGQAFVGSRIPFIDQSQLTTEGARNDTFDYIDVGIIFEVRPRINSDNEVALSIRVESSSTRKGETLFGGAIIDTRDYRTELTVASGQTIVLGGIIQQEESEIIYKVPVLGDIPLLGLLFTKKDTSMRDIELMVLLRPTVTRSLEDVERLRREELRNAVRVREWTESREEEAKEESDEAE